MTAIEMKLTPCEMHHVAMHEAAHAVVAWSLKVPVREIRIGIKEDYAGYTQLDDSWPVKAFRKHGQAFRHATDTEMLYERTYLNLCILYAGSLVADTHQRLDSRADYEGADTALAQLSLSHQDKKRLIHKALKRASDILNRHHRKVLELASAILDPGSCGVLPYERLNSILPQRKSAT